MNRNRYQNRTNQRQLREMDRIMRNHTFDNALYEENIPNSDEIVTVDKDFDEYSVDLSEFSRVRDKHINE